MNIRIWSCKSKEECWKGWWNERQKILENVKYEVQYDVR